MAFVTEIQVADPSSGFSCGTPALDTYFARHAFANHSDGVGRAFVLRREQSDDGNLPIILGFYTLSMAQVESPLAVGVLKKKLPKYPLPVALIGRMAVDQRAQRRRFGEALLMHALNGALTASAILGCIGVIVDAKDSQAESFYLKYDFVPVQATGWPRRMLLPMGALHRATQP